MRRQGLTCGRRALLCTLALTASLACLFAMGVQGGGAKGGIAQELVTAFAASEASSEKEAASREKSEAYSLESLIGGVDLMHEGADVASLPKEFEDELLSLDGKSDVRVSEAGAVVGFTEPRPAIETYRCFKGELEAKGWTCTAETGSAQGSFVKSEGAYSWCAVACAEISGTTSVVVQSLRAEEPAAEE